VVNHPETGEVFTSCVSSCTENRIRGESGVKYGGQRVFRFAQNNLLVVNLSTTLHEMNTANAAQHDMRWHNDGHTITMRINRSEIEIVEVSCPGGDECSSRSGCVVKYFVSRYGLECNIGACAPEEVMEICWALVGDDYDIDAAQLWFVPIKDEVFYAWMQSRV